MSRINPTQIRITGSSAAAAAAVVDASMFMVQQGAGGDSTAVKTVTAAVMQDYFGDPDISAASGADALKLVFVSGTGDRKELFADAGTGLQFTPSTDDLSVGGDVTVGDDIVLSSDASRLSFGAGADVTFTHDNGTGMDVASAGDFDLASSAGNVSIEAAASDKKVTIKGDHESSVAIHLDGDAAAGSIVDIDAGQLDIDASDWVKIDAADEIELQTTSADGHITLHSAHTAGQAILIDANAAAGSILDVDAGILTVDTQGAATHTIGGAFLLDGASTVGIQGAGTISVGTADAAVAVNIGHSQSEVTIGDNLTVTGDATVAGSLTVQGTVTTVDTANLQVEDPLILLGSGSSGEGAAGDRGLIMAIGSGESNPAMYWDESASQFAFVRTSASANDTAVTPDEYSPLRIAALNATSGDFSGDMTAATITMTGFTVDADGDTALKSLAVDNSSTIGCDADTDIVTLANQSMVIANDVDFNIAKTSGLQLGGTAVTSTAAELNHLDGIADAAYDQGNDSVVFFDATDSKLKYEAANDFVTAKAGAGLSADGSGKFRIRLEEQIFTSASMTSGTAATLTVAAGSQLSNSLAVYQNGLLLRSGAGQAYTVSGTTLTLADALDANDVLIVRYQRDN